MKTPGHKSLIWWLVRTGTTQADFARRCGISYSHAKKIIAEGRRPGIDTARRIELLTGIDANAFGPWRARNGKGNAERWA